MATIKLTRSTLPFEAMGVPKFCRMHYVGAQVKLPANLKYNYTYYKYIRATNELKAFRVLAIALRTFNGSISALVQFPNESPMWINDAFADPIFDTKESYFNYAAGYGVQSCLDWVCVRDLYPEYSYASVIGLKGHTWTWQEGRAHTSSGAPIEYFLITDEGTFVCIGEGWYYSKEECVKNHLNGLTIDEFAEEPVVIKTIVLPATQKIHTLRFIED